MNNPIYLLTFVAALGSGLVAGIFFAFSNFVMKASARISPAQGISVMESINVVLNRWFSAVFFGTAACCLILTITSLIRWQKPGAGYLLVGSLLYLIGTILVTIACNVPLNDALAAVDPSSADAGPVWSNYVKNWIGWNHMRAIASFDAAASFTVELSHSGYR
jgi:uncharacterized membrane protein